MIRHSQLPQHVRGAETGYPWEGTPTGMASNTLEYTALTVQQNVPNMGPAQTAPQTQVNATHEQGEGRSPGWQWGWMRKNIPLTFHALTHKQRKFPPISRPEVQLTAGAHAPGIGGQQNPRLYKTNSNRTLPAPRTAYYVASDGAPLPAWGEPV